MRLAVMQPYFLPYLGYFSLIAATDHFVVLDAVQYIRRGWVNRNRILKPGGAAPQHVRVPVARHARETPIREIAISGDHDWKGLILRQIAHYKQRAPCYNQAKSILERCFEFETQSLAAWNVHCLHVVCGAVGLTFNYSYFDDIAKRVEPVSHAGEWALHIATAMKATTYVNLPGTPQLFDLAQFAQRDIAFQLLTNRLTEYSQKNKTFVAGLSILDVLMFNSLDETRQLIMDYVVDEQKC